jgi:hypothetical protein
MTFDTLRKQIDQWLDGDLPESEIAQLKKSLEQTPGALEFLRDRALLHTMLAKAAALDCLPSHSATNDTQLDHSSAKPFLPAKRFFAPPWVWASLATVAYLLLISMLLLPNVVASPAELIQKTLAEYQTTMDRCYAVKVETEGRPLRRRLPGRAVPTDSKLWVRGSRFVQFFDSAGDRLVWGRDAQGAVWFTLSGKSAASFEANEIPDVLQDVCDLRTLDVTTLLESLLRDYDLQFTDRMASKHSILATPRPEVSNSKYGMVEIEIDSRSGLIHRVSLERLRAKRVLAVISFSLEELQKQEDSFYEVRTHLQPNADVLERGTGFGRRSELLREFLQKLRFPNATPQSL